ncbi:MAG: lipopolysaccharide assembly protein LapA domain-containing protein [Pseudomonadota bacterium]|nr:lipopolysaccharide assembly protein LapA domain-containing protein [Pseudomonadota bacterium]
MRIVLIVLLVLVFGYSIGLVLANRVDVEVNLLFSHVPAMNLGLLLIITIALGVLIGLLLGLQVFRVFQLHWEVSRLQKELDLARAKHIQAAAAASAAQSTPVTADLSKSAQPPSSL